jgi:hypothetical protein
MAKVKALYSYTYDYEGSKISFNCGDEFQLLAKVNNDWWHVRRWFNQCSQDIYIPAVYVKEVGDDENPLYQNMAELKKQVEDFKKKASSTPPPPTARKPKLDRTGSDKKNKIAAAARVAADVSSPEHKTETESVADRAKRIAKNLQARKSEEELFPVPRAGSVSMLIAPKRSQSTKREEGSSSPKLGLKPNEVGGPVANLLAIASKPRSRSINVRPGEQRDKDSASPPDLHRADTAPPGKSLTAPAKGKLPPPVLPKGERKVNRPKSMVIVNPPEGQETEDTLTSALQSQLTEQLKKQRSAATVVTTATSTNGERRTSPQEEAASTNSKLVQNGALPYDPASATSVPSPSLTQPQQSSLPDGWTEHKTSEGHTYYYNAVTGKSSWTRPPSVNKTTPTTIDPTHQNSEPSNPLEKVAPRGWTKEINVFSQTPIYTNSKTGEKWALAKDGTGNYYYYNMSDSQLTVGELPDVADVPSKAAPPQENVYDHIEPKVTSTTENEISGVRPRTHSDPRIKPESCSTPSPSHSLSQPSSSLAAQLEVFHYSLAHMQLKKHGYLQRKRLFDAQGKRAKGGWQKVYTSLDNFQLKFYTDHKIATDAGAKPLATFHLLQATVCTYTKEKKTKNAFVVSSPFGEQFLLQAEAAPQMNDWCSTIETAVHKANEDFKLHPDKYCDLVPEGDGALSPRVKHGDRRKPSTGADEEDELDDMESVADKSDRIRTRLRRLMAKRPQMETLQKKGIIEDPIFGADLAKFCERTRTNVPQFLVHFMEHIEKHGLDIVGLYRLSGNAASVQKLRCLVEQDQPYDLDDSEWADINIVTGCLKLYFRELPDPLVPACRFKGFIDAIKTATTPAQRVAAIAAQVKELPKFNYCTLIALITHLRRVMDNAVVNKMYSQNVAIVFGPTLLRSEGDPFEMAKLTAVQNGIVELMLIEFDKIFTKKI